MPRGRRSRNPWLDDIPSVDEIINEAIKNLGLTSAFIKNTPPYVVISRLEQECHRLYSEYERRIREKVKRGAYGSVDPRTFETSLSNSRKARAGATLEKLFVYLLNLYGISYERNIHIRREVEFDFVFPDSKRIFIEPKHVVLLSVKREVRERWKLTVGDAYILRHKYGYPLLDNIWFISLGEPPIEAVTAMASLCIRIYVPNGTYNNVISLVKTDLSKDEIKRIRRFSEIMDDIIKIAVTREKEAEECEIRRYEINLAKMNTLLKFLDRR